LRGKKHPTSPTSPDIHPSRGKKHATRTEFGGFRTGRLGAPEKRPGQMKKEIWKLKVVRNQLRPEERGVGEKKEKGGRRQSDDNSKQCPPGVWSFTAAREESRKPQTFLGVLVIELQKKGGERIVGDYGRKEAGQNWQTVSVQHLGV